MKIFDRLFKKHNVYDTELSNYSRLPRYYYINGVKYDIDSPKSVASIPVCSTAFKINDEIWGIDTVLREHVNRYYSAIPEKLKSVCYPKITEFEYSGYKIESSSERNARITQENEDKEKEAKLRSITKEDMEQFKFTNFEIVDPFYDNKMCIMLISEHTKRQIVSDMQMLNEVIRSACGLAGINIPIHLPIDDLVFGAKIMNAKNGEKFKQYYTFFQCEPYTKTGKLSKYPLILRYATKARHEYNQKEDHFGEVYYRQDGVIGKCRLNFWYQHTGYFFEFALVEDTIVVKKVETAYGGDKKVLYKGN